MRRFFGEIWVGTTGCPHDLGPEPIWSKWSLTTSHRMMFSLQVTFKPKLFFSYWSWTSMEVSEVFSLDFYRSEKISKNRKKISQKLNKSVSSRIIKGSRTPEESRSVSRVSHLTGSWRAGPWFKEAVDRWRRPIHPSPIGLSSFTEPSYMFHVPTSGLTPSAWSSLLSKQWALVVV